MRKGINMKKKDFDEMKLIYELLSDDISKDIFLNRLCFNITDDMAFIDCIVERDTKGMDTLYSGQDIKKLQSVLDSYQDKKVIIYGAGFTGKILLNMLGKQQVECFCDRNPELQKNGVSGMSVNSPEEIVRHYQNKAVILLAVWKEYQEEVTYFFQKNGFTKENFVDGISFIHPQELEENTYFEPQLYSFDKEEVFVDAGCLDFGTSVHLLKHCGTVKKIIAFEPDPESYKRCQERIKGFQNVDIELIPAAVWSRRETLQFSGYGGAASSVAESGRQQIQGISIDESVDGRVTFIKMDVEGAELEALIGAKKTICAWKPKLAISIYHKPEDLIELPAYINKLNPDYRLYLRHYKNTPGDTVLYAL